MFGWSWVDEITLGAHKSGNIHLQVSKWMGKS